MNLWIMANNTLRSKIHVYNWISQETSAVLKAHRCFVARTMRSTVISLHSCRIWSSHSRGCEHLYLLGYNAVQSVESQLTFRRNLSLTSSGSKGKPSKKPTWSTQQTEILLDLFFDPESGGGMSLRNIGWLSTDYTALYPRRQNSNFNCINYWLFNWEISKLILQ
jgi:hypothetical protein